MEIFTVVAILLIFGPVFIEIFTGGTKLHWIIHVFLGGVGILIAGAVIFVPK